MDEVKRAQRVRRLGASTICPVENCGVGIPRTMLMCGAHWREVPHALKVEVRRSARKLWQEMSDEAYRLWKDDALAAIEAVEEPA